ncbi:MAG: PTS sugar transporter subunit IIA, partial [Candidatus Omnitrophota bacterium]|nr:PTS sugar transporter subunit IIA [Candidatus Omnitrophota bacterium]
QRFRPFSSWLSLKETKPLLFGLKPNAKSGFKILSGSCSPLLTKKGESMQIMSFLSKKAIITDLKSTKKEDVIKELVDILINSGDIEKCNRAKLVEALMAREALGSTAIGQGIAIPHAKLDFVTNLIAAFGLSKKGVDFDSLDGESAYIFFLLIAPQDSAGPHLKALARISRLLKDKYFRDTLRACIDDKSVIKIITQEDEKKV